MNQTFLRNPLYIGFAAVAALILLSMSVTIVPETRIGADLEIDSVEIFDIVMELEDLYDISFPIEQASNIDTVRDLVATIRQLANV